MDSFSNFCLGHKPLVNKMISMTRCSVHGAIFLHWFCLPWMLKLEPTFSGEIPNWPPQVFFFFFLLQILKSQQVWSKNAGCFHELFLSTKTDCMQLAVAQRTALNGDLPKSFPLGLIARAHAPFLARILCTIPCTWRAGSFS